MVQSLFTYTKLLRHRRRAQIGRIYRIKALSSPRKHNAGPRGKAGRQGLQRPGNTARGGGGAAGQLTKIKMHTSDTFCNTVGIADYI